MLSNIPKIQVSETVWRYASAKNDVETLTDMGFDIGELTDILEFLRDNKMLSSPDDLLDNPFRRKITSKGAPSRYSDGSLSVFYSAIEPETAADEISYHGKNFFSDKRVYYNLFYCSFNGEVKDLRLKRNDWPMLIDDNYAFCNRVAVAAIEDQLDGLLVPSARNNSGTCSPVFNRHALSKAIIKDIVSFDF